MRLGVLYRTVKKNYQIGPQTKALGQKKAFSMVAPSLGFFVSSLFWKFLDLGFRKKGNPTQNLPCFQNLKRAKL